MLQFLLTSSRRRVASRIERRTRSVCETLSIIMCMQVRVYQQQQTFLLADFRQTQQTVQTRTRSSLCNHGALCRY